MNATLENTGELAGNYTLVFYLDDVMKNSRKLMVEAGKTDIYSVNLSSSIEGVHTVIAGGKSVTFEVEKTQTGIPSNPAEAITIGLLLAMVLLTIWKTKTP